VTPDRLLDRLRWGRNIAARAVGTPTIAYRPSGAGDPLDSSNRYLRLPAAFTPIGSGYTRPNGYGSALWIGTYDASHTRPGDYLVQEAATWFIASQDHLLPNLCVEVNRTVSFRRSHAPSVTGANTYAGVTAATIISLTGGWPASVLGISSSGRTSADLPMDQSTAYWTILLPEIPTVRLQSSDLVVDDLGRTGIIVGAELSRLGWRLTIRETST
jgi:hypothetical protein